MDQLKRGLTIKVEMGLTGQQSDMIGIGGRRHFAVSKQILGFRSLSLVQFHDSAIGIGIGRGKVVDRRRA